METILKFDDSKEDYYQGDRATLMRMLNCDKVYSAIWEIQKTMKDYYEEGEDELANRIRLILEDCESAMEYYT